MSPVGRTASIETVKQAWHPESTRQLRPMVHRASSSQAALGTGRDVDAMSAFVTETVPNKLGFKHAVHGNCAPCLAAMRDAYEEAHRAHLAKGS